MKKLIIGLFILCFNEVIAQEKITMEFLGYVTVVHNGTQKTSTSNPVSLRLNKWTKGHVLFQDETLNVTANFKLKSYKSRRSQHKASGILLLTKSTCTNQGKKVRKKTERNIFLNDQRTFDEKNVFNFKSGISNNTITVSYTCKLPN